MNGSHIKLIWHFYEQKQMALLYLSHSFSFHFLEIFNIHMCLHNAHKQNKEERNGHFNVRKGQQQQQQTQYFNNKRNN